LQRFSETVYLAAFGNPFVTVPEDLYFFSNQQNLSFKTLEAFGKIRQTSKCFHRIAKEKFNYFEGKWTLLKFEITSGFKDLFTKKLLQRIVRLVPVNFVSLHFFCLY
jgi:hypothetical protein